MRTLQTTLIIALLLFLPSAMLAQGRPGVICDADCGDVTPPPPANGIQVPVDRGMGGNQRGLGTVKSATVTTGGTATVQGSSSYTYKVPLFSLPGRAGMDLNLNVYYNSHVWTADPSGGVLLGFDRDFMGFQINFGFLEWNPSANGPAAVLSTADGAKHTFAIDISNLVLDPSTNTYRCANQICLYNSDDSSYINISRPLGTLDGNPCTGPNNCASKDATVTYKNGTIAVYRSFAVVTNDTLDEFVQRPYHIQDTHGNSINITYANDKDLSISSITDSVGRVINFIYNNGLLSCITDGASCTASGARTYTFTWDAAHAVNFNFAFPAQALIGGNLSNITSGFTIPVVTGITRPNGTGVKFSYGDWGIVNDIQEVSATGAIRYELNYDFPAASAGKLSVAPTYTHQTETVNGKTATWSFGVTTNSAGLITSSTITNPVGLATTTTFSQKGDWQDGLPIQVQLTPGDPSCAPSCLAPTPNPVPLLTTNTVWASDLSEAQSGIANGGDPTGQNPRPASVTTILDDGSQSQVTFQYDNSSTPVAAGAPHPFTGSGSVIDKVETDFGASSPGPVLRETVIAYTSLPGHILGLPTDIKVKDGNSKVTSHTVLAYDGASASPQGNLISSTTYADPVKDTGGVTTTFTYDAMGNKIKEQLGCCTQTAWSYSSTTQNSLPDSITFGPAGNQLTTSYTYNLAAGTVATQIDVNGNVTSLSYDISGRPIGAKGPDGFSTTTSYDDNGANVSVTTSNSANSLVTSRTADFKGNLLTDQTLNGTTVVSTVTYINDVLGRPIQVSNPYGPGDTPVYTTSAYDLLGRRTQTTPPAASQAGQNPYTTSITGPITISTDPAGHQSKQYSNALGQLVRVDLPGPNGGAAGSGSVAISGTEQTVSVATGGGATPGTGNITLSGAENSKQVQTHAATVATGSVTISGTEKSQFVPGQTTCLPNGGGCDTTPAETIYDSGTCSITINGHSNTVSFGQGDTPYTIASNMVNGMNADNAAFVTASLSGATVQLTSKTTGSSSNIAVSSSCSSDMNSFSTTNSSALSGGTDNAYTTAYNTGTVTVTVNSASKVYTYGQNDTNATVINGLVSLMHNDSSFPVDATASGSIINLTTRATGAGTGYSLAVSSTTTSQNFSSPAFTLTASGANLTSGQNGVITDSGTVTLKIQTDNGSPVAASVAGSGFETPSLGSGVAAYQYHPAGSGWTFSSNNGLDASGAFVGGAGLTGNNSGFTSANPPAPEGGQVAFLQGGPANSISQLISLQAGFIYTVTFKAAQRANNSQDFAVKLDGTSLGTFHPAGSSYQSLSTPTFTAATGTHTLQFVGIDSAGGDNTAFIDAVSLTGIAQAPDTDGVTITVPYKLGDTFVTVANALTLALNNNSNSPVTASLASGSGTITLTAKSQGANTNYTVTAASQTSQGAYFGHPSFTASASSLTGGADPTFSLATPITTAYSYDPYGRVLQVNKGQQTQSYVYDGLGRTLSVATPETAGLPVQYTYTDFGAVAKKTDARSLPGTSTPVTTTFAYDPLNRIQSVSYNDGITPNITYTYNPPNSAYNTGARLASVSNSVETKAYQYDILGRVTQCLETIGNNTYAVNYTYGLDGQVSSIVYPSQLKMNYGYDAIGRLTQMQGQRGTNTGSVLTINSSDYNAAGLPAVVTYGNGVKGTFGYNAQLQTSSIQYAGASPLLSLTYAYGGSTNNGQIQSITDNLDSTHSTSYAYDPLGRLQIAQTVDQTSPVSWQLSFAYDIYGNRLHETPTGGAGPMPSSHVVVDPVTNRIQGSGLVYDAGNVVSDGLNNYVFDANNNLTSSSPTPGWPGSPSSFTYGPDGGLVSRNGTVYIYSGGKVIAEYPNGAAAASPAVEYVNLGGQQIASVAGGAVMFNFADHLSIRASADAAGNQVRSSGTFPDGESWYDNGQPSDFKFTSYRRDANSGLDYADARFYSPRLGRFMSADPVLGDNRYAYVGNDPINRVDPTGLSGQCTVNPFDTRPLPLCGPDQLGSAVGPAGSTCGINFGSNGVTFSGGSNCTSFSVNFDGSRSRLASLQQTLHDVLVAVLPDIDTCPAGTFECPTDGVPLFEQPQCDPRWCIFDSKPTKEEIESDVNIFKVTERYFDPWVIANCQAAASFAQIHELEYANLLIDGYYAASDLNKMFGYVKGAGKQRYSDEQKFGEPSPGDARQGVEKTSDPGALRAENNRQIDRLLQQAAYDSKHYPCRLPLP